MKLISDSRCLVAPGPTGESVSKIRETEKQLADKKHHLETFQSEFCDIKKKFDEACKKLEQVSILFVCLLSKTTIFTNSSIISFKPRED